jgi:hypothetical protein
LLTLLCLRRFNIPIGTLDAASNQLTGTAPSISNMVNLKNLHLYENGFTGTIPESILQLQSVGMYRVGRC